MRETFTTFEREELLSNQYILKVSDSQIEFSKDFKGLAVYEHYEQGKTCKQVLKDAGIPDWLNEGDYAKDAIKRWSKQLKRKTPFKKRGRPPKSSKPAIEMDLRELQARIAYLEAENEFLKKLEALEKQTLKKGSK
jgi:transposase